MLTDSSIALRSASPSLLMRVIKFVIARGKPVFPHDEAGFHTVMAGRRLLEKLGAEVMEGAAIVDLPELGGSNKLRASGLSLFTLVDYSGH